MTQPLCHRGSEDVFEDYPAVADHYSEVSSGSEAETSSHADSVTEELHSSVTSSRSTWSYGYHPLIAPPPSPASSVSSSSSDSARRPNDETSSKKVLIKDENGVDDDCSYIDTGSHHEGLNEAHFADQERDEAEDNGSFIDERSHPASFDEDRPSWASFGGDLSSIEDQDEKMNAVGRWVEDNP